MATPSKVQVVQERINDAIRQHADVVSGHDHVHPDRNDCGGVGGCKLMMAEHDAEQEVIAMVTHAARQNYRLGINLEARS